MIYVGKAQTFGDVIVYLPGEKILYAVGVRVTSMVPYLADGHAAGWIDALDWISRLDIDVVVPGHGFLGAKQTIADLRGYLAELRDRVRKCYENHLSEKEAISTINMKKGRDWAG